MLTLPPLSAHTPTAQCSHSQRSVLTLPPLSAHNPTAQCSHSHRSVLTIPPLSAHCQRSTEFLNIVCTNSGFFTYTRPGEFLFSTQHALVWQSAIHVQIRCCVVLCCAQTVANSLRHNCDPVSAPSFACFPYIKYKQNSIYGLNTR